MREEPLRAREESYSAYLPAPPYRARSIASAVFIDTPPSLLRARVIEEMLSFAHPGTFALIHSCRSSWWRKRCSMSRSFILVSSNQYLAIRVHLAWGVHETVHLSPPDHRRVYQTSSVGWTGFFATAQN